MKHIIKLIPLKTAKEIIEKREPRGLFVTIEGNKFIAIDNSDGNCWTEEFDTLRQCNRNMFRSSDKPVVKRNGWKHTPVLKSRYVSVTVRMFACNGNI